MKKIEANWTELHCEACNGTGVQAAPRAEKPGHRIYPPNCVKCNGAGRKKVFN
jgi:DnaJ-class molecular chaperone